MRNALNHPVTMARRHILGDIAHRCEPLHNVPVYLNDTGGDSLGFADESHGNYADAITFHLDDGFCKKLVTGHFTYSFEFDYAEDADAESTSSKRRIKLSSIQLVERKGYAKPIPKHKAESAAKA